MFTVYIIQSSGNSRYYIDVTSDMKKRLKYHNSGANQSTRKRGPWRLVYKEEYDDKSAAGQRERQIKKYKGGEAFGKLILH